MVTDRKGLRISDLVSNTFNKEIDEEVVEDVRGKRMEHGRCDLLNTKAFWCTTKTEKSNVYDEEDGPYGIREIGEPFGNY